SYRTVRLFRVGSLRHSIRAETQQLSDNCIRLRCRTSFAKPADLLSVQSSIRPLLQEKAYSRKLCSATGLLDCSTCGEVTFDEIVGDIGRLDARQRNFNQIVGARRIASERFGFDVQRNTGCIFGPEDFKGVKITNVTRDVVITQRHEGVTFTEEDLVFAGTAEVSKGRSARLFERIFVEDVHVVVSGEG